MMSDVLCGNLDILEKISNDFSVWNDCDGDYVEARIYLYELENVVISEITDGHLKPFIKDVKVYNNRAVIVHFSDDTFTRARCSKEDAGKFSVDAGIAICLLKKMLGMSNNRFRELMDICREKVNKEEK